MDKGMTTDREAYRRVLAVGDIHSCCMQLESLLETVAFDETQDLLILMGDYTDRGKEPVDAVKFVMDLASRPHVVCLRGNHDAMCLESYAKWPYPQGAGPNDLWGFNGGRETRRAFARHERYFEPGFIQKYLEFLRSLPLYYRLETAGRNFLFAHAGIDSKKDFASQSEDDLVWIRDDFLFGYKGVLDGQKVTVTVGHTPIVYVPEAMLEGGDLEPRILRGCIIMTDTAAFAEEGALSCVDVLHQVFWQYVNEDQCVRGPCELRPLALDPRRS
jgi:serine/threonine protein phosphatase 1